MQNRHPIIHPILDRIQDGMIVQVIQEILPADMELQAMNPLQIRHILLIHPVAPPLAPQVVACRLMSHHEAQVAPDSTLNTIQKQLNLMVSATKQLAGITFLHIIHLPRVQYIRKYPETQQH